jgi:hypothetical protein
MLKILTITAASIAMLSAAAADLPRKEPPPPAVPVGKAPIGKYPVGKAPIGKYPQPVAAGLSCCKNCVTLNRGQPWQCGESYFFVGTSARRMMQATLNPVSDANFTARDRSSWRIRP